MNVETFCEHFATFADAPNGIAKLRELILQLAVQGKLVLQDVNEAGPSGPVLFDAVDVANSDDDEEPVRVPNGWMLVPVSQVCTHKSGDSKMIKGQLHNEPAEGRFQGFSASGPDVWCDDWKHEGEAVIVSAVGARCGKTFKATGKWCAIANTHIVWPNPTMVSLDYLHLILNNEGFWKRGGSAQPFVKTRETFQKKIGVPPLEEQRRIVEKVDQLLGLCDELAARQAAQREKRQRLVGATLDRLVSPQTSRHLACRGGLTASAPLDENTTGAKANEPPGQARWRVMKDDAHRLRNHFDQLFDTPTTIPQLRQTILQLAVQGKLVPQDHNDEPASLLLERIFIEKAKLAGEKKVRQPKARSEDGEPPFALPNRWVWAQAEDVCKPADVITYGVLKPEWVTDGVPTVRVQDMKNGQIVVGQIGQCSPARADKFSKTTLEEGDLLIAKDGATLGKTAFVPPSLVGGNVTQHVLRFPISPHVWRWYIRLVVDSPLGQAWMRKETRGVALPGVNVEDFRRMPIPLPPLAEQKRIVTKVTELLSLCDALEAKLTQAESASTQLLSAAVHHLLQN